MVGFGDAERRFDRAKLRDTDDSALTTTERKQKQKITALSEVVRRASTVEREQRVEMTSLVESAVDELDGLVDPSTLSTAAMEEMVSKVTSIAKTISDEARVQRRGLSDAFGREPPQLTVRGVAAEALATALAVPAMKQGVTVIPEGTDIIPLANHGAALVPFTPGAGRTLTIVTENGDCTFGADDDSGGFAVECGRVKTPIALGEAKDIGGNTFFFYKAADGGGRRRLQSAGGTAYAGSAHAAAFLDGDPHLRLADGGRADFRGQNDTFFDLLSSPGLQFAAKTYATDFLLPRSNRRPLLVHGSFFVEAAWTILAKGKLLGVSVDARKVGFEVFDGNKGETLTESSRVWTAWRGYGVQVAYKQSTLYVNANGWQVNATRKPIYNWIGGPSKWRLDISIKTLNRKSAPTCYPHGIIGQSFDFDGVAHDGAIDDYEAGVEYTTKAQAEGAIEGDHKDYSLVYKHDVRSSRFSRFYRSVTDECPPAKLASKGKAGNGAVTAGSFDDDVQEIKA